MPRRVLALTFVVLLVGACGGSSPSVAPSSAAPSASETASSGPSSSEAASVAPSPGATTKTAACAAVALRKLPSTTGPILGRVSIGTTVQAVDVVSGDPYTVGACGTPGSGWLKIDQVNGRTVQSVYGVPFVYSASGFYQ